MKKKVLLTGISGNFGRILLENFINDDYEVAGVDLNYKDLEQIRSVYPGKKLLLKNFDLTEEVEVENLFIFLKENNFIPNILINNAGIIVNQPFCKFDNGKLIMHEYDLWSKVIKTNLDSTFLVTKKFTEFIINKRQFNGVVISISSISSNGNIGQVAYSASKAAVEAFMNVCAKELGPLGMRFISISPGFIDVPSTKAALSEDQTKYLLNQIPLKNFGKVTDIYEAIKFAINCKYLTGNKINIDGGLKI